MGRILSGYVHNNHQKTSEIHISVGILLKTMSTIKAVMDELKSIRKELHDLGHRLPERGMFLDQKESELLRASRSTKKFKDSAEVRKHLGI